VGKVRVWQVGAPENPDYMLMLRIDSAVATNLTDSPIDADADSTLNCITSVPC
jgi:hypothetical protein